MRPLNGQRNYPRLANRCKVNPALALNLLGNPEERCLAAGDTSPSVAEH
jgi:hypothetical protein